ncbi:MAG: hypothetical protein HY985_15280 [Magnetospirillum sp.]|nr:hypothetical protein [Magnetospirillum sp.]
MRFTADVPSLTVDLSLPPEQRWKSVVADEKTVIADLFETGWAAVTDTFSGPLRPLLAAIEAAYGGAYWASRARYKAEVYALSRMLGVPKGRLAALQNMYTFSHVGSPYRTRDKSWCLADEAGCTAGIVWHPPLGMIHIRTLDWGLRDLGYALARATRRIKFINGPAGTFTLVGVLGHVGGLSGIAAGRFSITINWAPKDFWLPKFATTPDTLLRTIMETCPDYDSAVAAVMAADLSAAAFFTICGVTEGQACIIECARINRLPLPGLASRMVRHRRDIDAATGVLVQANHYAALRNPSGASLNDEVDRAQAYEKDKTNPDCKSLLATSRERQATLEAGLNRTRAVVGASLGDFLRLLDERPVFNPETRQKMAFIPATGAILVERGEP